MWAELERARETLAVLKSLQLQEGVAREAEGVAREAEPTSCGVVDDNLTSAEWLKVATSLLSLPLLWNSLPSLLLIS